MSQDEGLTQRQRRILDAARQLMRGPPGGFSMRNLADAAQVSHATPYNLFGSKHRIISLVLDDDIAKFQHILSARPQQEALAQVFEVARVASDLIFADPVFYRASFSVVSSLESTEFTKEYLPPRFLVWLQLAAAAAAAGALRAGVNPRILASLMIGCFDLVVRNWLREDFAQRRFDAELGYALAAVLGACCSDHEQRRLQALLAGFQSQIEMLVPEFAVAHP